MQRRVSSITVTPSLYTPSVIYILKYGDRYNKPSTIQSFNWIRKRMESRWRKKKNLHADDEEKEAEFPRCASFYVWKFYDPPFAR